MNVQPAVEYNEALHLGFTTNSSLAGPMGAETNLQQGRAAKMLPYGAFSNSSRGLTTGFDTFQDTSHRAQIEDSHISSDDPSSFDSLSSGVGGYASSPDPPTNIPVNDRYPTDLVPGADAVHEPESDYALSRNGQPWPSPTAASSLLNSVPPYPSSSQPEPGSFSHLPGTIVDASGSHGNIYEDFHPDPENWASMYSSTNSRPVSSAPDEFDHPFPYEFRESSLGPNSVATNRPTFPWDWSPLGPSTNINDGTFIAGNVNHIERHGEPGEYSMEIELYLDSK
jgi:hypothetical protein